MLEKSQAFSVVLGRTIKERNNHLLRRFMAQLQVIVIFLFLRFKDCKAVKGGISLMPFRVDPMFNRVF